MHIIVCEDNIVIEKLVGSFLEKKGHHVFCEPDPEAALRLLENNHDIRIVISKWLFKEMRGDAFYRSIKKGRYGRYIYIIALTAADNKAEMLDIFKSGADDYLTKPVDVQELNARLSVAARIVNLERKHAKSLQNARELNTQLHRAHDDLKKSHARLLQQEKLSSLGQLAGGIAHEINTPIQFINSNIQFMQDAFSDRDTLLQKYGGLECMLKTGGPIEPALQEIKTFARDIDLDYLNREIPAALSQVKDGMQQIASIVQALKEFSQPYASDQEKPVAINDVIENVLTVSHNQWAEVAEVTTCYEPSLPMVSCVPGDLSQALLNILINAVQAIADTMSGEPTKGTIIISTGYSGSHAEIRISDNGPGIPAEIRDKIFDPFFTTREVGKGAGQGLTIAYSVITQKHKGELLVETEPGKGTTFIIRLPL